MGEANKTLSARMKTNMSKMVKYSNKKARNRENSGELLEEHAISTYLAKSGLS